MQSIAFDIPLEIEQRQIEAIRQQTVAERLASVFVMMVAARHAAIQRLAKSQRWLDGRCWRAAATGATPKASHAH